MSEGAEALHIVRGGAREQFNIHEVLCGFEAPKGGNRISGPPSMATCWKCILLQCGRPIPTDPALPEHARLQAAKQTDDATQLVGEFFNWLGEQGYVLGKYLKHDTEFLSPMHEPVTKLLSKFFGINDNALEAEKMAMLTHMRETHKAREWALSEGRAALKAP